MGIKKAKEDKTLSKEKQKFKKLSEFWNEKVKPKCKDILLWLEDCWWLKALVAIVVVFGLPRLLAKGMEWSTFKDVPGSNSDWFSFLGGYVGAIITIVGVYWQVRKQSNDSKKQLEDQIIAEKEASFREARPLFILSMNCNSININDKSNPIYASNYDNLDKLFRKKTPVTYFCINNVSNKFMAGVIIRFYSQKGLEEPDKIIKIDKVSEDSKCRIIYKESIDKEDNLEKIEICFTTPIRERIILTFIIENNEIKYQKDLSEIENKGGDVDNYSLDNFQEMKCYIG